MFRFKLPKILPFFKPSKPKNILTLHLGSDAVLAAVCSFPENYEEKVKILGIGKQKQGKSSMRSRKILDLDSVLEATDLAIQRAYLSAGIKPKQTIFGTSSGTILGIGLTVRLNRPEPEHPISQKELAAILSKIQEKTVDKARANLLSYNFALKNLDLLELSVTQYRLDGKKVISPLNLSGKTLEACILHTFSQNEDLKSLNMVASELDLKVKTFVETSLSVANNLSTKNESGILLLAEENTTEVTVFRNDKIFGNKVYNLGKDSTFWTKGLATCFLEFEEVRPLPSQFFVLGEEGLVENLRLNLESPLLKSLPLAGLAKIEKIEQEAIFKALAAQIA